MTKLPIEEIISRVMQEGKFDNLPGRGKPLKLDQNPHQDPDWRVAHHLLKSNGFSLPWIDKLSEIHNNLQAARQHAANSHLKIRNVNQLEWETSLDQFKTRLKAINEQIHTYNLEVPNLQFQIPFIKIDQELERVMNNTDS